MDIIFIISLIIFVFLAALIIILVKKILKVIFFIAIIFLVFALAFGFFIIQDVKDIRNNFTNSNKLFLLTDNDKILTGILVGDETVFIDENQVNNYNKYLQEKDYDSLLGDNYKIILVKLDIMNELEDEYEILDKNITRKQLFNAFRSEFPSKELNLEKKKSTEDGKEINISDKIKFKGYLFAAVLVNDLAKSKNPLKVLIYYKKNYISVYPETILFKFVKSVPTSYVNKISAKVTIGIEKIKEKL